MDCKVVAEKLNTTQKHLRQFLRSKQSPFPPVGTGSRYSFNEQDFTKLKQAWEGREVKAPRISKKYTHVAPLTSEDKALSCDVIYRTDRRTKAEVAAHAKARVDRLEAALIARGMHVSQMRDRDTWSYRATS